MCLYQARLHCSGCQSITGQTHTDRQKQKHLDLRILHIVRLWDEAEALSVHTQGVSENSKQKCLSRKTYSTPGPALCEKTRLTTKLLFHA